MMRLFFFWVFCGGTGRAARHRTDNILWEGSDTKIRSRSETIRRINLYTCLNMCIYDPTSIVENKKLSSQELPLRVSATTRTRETDAAKGMHERSSGGEITRGSIALSSGNERSCHGRVVGMDCPDTMTVPFEQKHIPLCQLLKPMVDCCWRRRLLNSLKHTRRKIID